MALTSFIPNIGPTVTEELTDTSDNNFLEMARGLVETFTTQAEELRGKAEGQTAIAAGNLAAPVTFGSLPGLEGSITQSANILGQQLGSSQRVAAAKGLGVDFESLALQALGQAAGVTSAIGTFETQAEQLELAEQQRLDLLEQTKAENIFAEEQFDFFQNLTEGDIFGTTGSTAQTDTFSSAPSFSSILPLEPFVDPTRAEGPTGDDFVNLFVRSSSL